MPRFELTRVYAEVFADNRLRDAFSKIRLRRASAYCARQPSSMGAITIMFFMIWCADDAAQKRTRQG